MKKVIRKLFSQVAAKLAPYRIVNVSLDSVQTAWTFKEALEWVAANDSQVFGLVCVFDARGRMVAAQKAA